MKKTILCVGESLIRLATDVGIHLYDSDRLQFHFGGAEANVAANLGTLEHAVRYFTKLPTNPLGDAALRKLKSAGVDTRLVVRGGERVGTYYVESGVGPRAANVTYDRSHSAFATLTSEDWNEEELLEGITLLHVTGITAALSDETRKLTIQLAKAAKKRGILVNFDVNYRSKLWTIEECGVFLREILPYVDYLSAGILDAKTFLGVEPPSNDCSNERKYVAEKMVELYPNLSVIYSTIRTVQSASVNTLQGTLYQNGEWFESPVHTIDAIVDRIGGGDAYAAGILHGILSDKEPQYTVSFATAYSVLKHTVQGDANPFSIETTEQAMQRNAAVSR